MGVHARGAARAPRRWHAGRAGGLRGRSSWPLTHAAAHPPPARPTHLPPVADKHLEWIARLMAVANAVLDAFRRAKAWAMSQGALVAAIAVLLLALLLRWLGWL